MKDSVLSLCDLTGNMVWPWLERDYHCTIVDLQHARGEWREGRLTRIGISVGRFTPMPSTRHAIVFAAPPCTHLASSGARWWKAKGKRALWDALEIVAACRHICEESGAPWMIENPVGRLSTHWRKPDYYFDPCDYGGYLEPPGDAYTKKTCLWTGGGFVMPEPRRVEPQTPNPIHHMPQTKDRGQKRSVTPMGFARAVFEANHG